MRPLVAKIILFGLCPLSIALGSWAVSDYSSRPGDSGQVITDLNSVAMVPESLVNDILAHSGTATLIVFYHPHCPCTNATVRNLERISPRFPSRTRIIAFAYCPADEPKSWSRSPLTTSLHQLKAEVISDQGGRYCAEFGICTSGHVLVYSGQGQLLFSGGITARRGHEGDCAATENLLKKTNGEIDKSIHWPVYGCPIVTSGEQR